MNVINYIRAGFAGIFITAVEETPVEAELNKIADELKYTLYMWTVTNGLLNVESGELDGNTDPLGIIEQIQELPEKSIVILSDFVAFLGDSTQPVNPVLCRMLKETVQMCRAQQKAVVIVSCRYFLPVELEKEFVLLESPLPDSEQLKALAKNIADTAGIASFEEERTAEAAQGLSLQEAEDVMALSVVEKSELCPRLIAQQKAKCLAKSGILSLQEQSVNDSDIGGLGKLKEWLKKRKSAFGKEAKEYGLPVPKGVLIVGIPGTGKSLTAKAAGNILGRPVLKLDVGKVFAGIVGESEANLRKALQTAEAMSPCILYLDEIEKAFAGTSGSTDSGVSARVFGTFLNWMQDRKSSVFVIATANDVSQLPPEFLRKGRWDELFFVDLPDESARESIWQIHLEKAGRDASTFKSGTLSRISEGYSGAEIEAAVQEALFNAFSEARDMKQADLLQALTEIFPLSATMKERIKVLKEWAEPRTRKAA